MLFTDYLKIKKSTLKGAGKGLFTTIPIPKGKRIVEYLGKIKRNAISNKIDLRYAFVVKPGYVIDAMHYKKGIAQYANDATGTIQIKNVKNNCSYEREGLRVFITATKNVKANTELLVYYGKEYWIEEDELAFTNPKTQQMATTKKTVKKAAPKKVVKKAAPKKAVIKKAAPKKAAKKAAPKKAAPKKSLPTKAAIKKATPSIKGKGGGKGGYYETLKNLTK